MKRARHVLLTIAVWVFVGHSAQAAPLDYAFSQVPSRFETRELTVGSRALGETCASRTIMPDGSICNPAFLGLATENSVLARVYLGNGYTALSTANGLLFKPITQEFLQDLFKNNSATGMEAHAGLVFTTKNFSASFSPYRVQYVSEVHNPNFPVVAVHAAMERRLSFAVGGSLEGLAAPLQDFSAGARLHLFQRSYIHGTFSLPQAITEKPETFMPMMEQKGIMLDPSIAWSPSRAPWSLMTSMTIRNIGVVTHRDSVFPDLADLDVGVGIEPPVKYGTFHFGLDLVDTFHAVDFASRIRLGGSYKYGVLEAMLGWNRNALTTGLQFGFQPVQVGIVYEFMRSDQEGAPVENRIATEISIKL